MKTSADDMTNRELFEYMNEMFQVILENMVTKKDLEEYVSKAEFRQSITAMERRLTAKINNLRIVPA